MTTPHTPGKLTFTENEYVANRFTIGVDGNWLMSIQHNGEQNIHTQRENMRRLTAACNACEGIPTETLEKAPPVPELPSRKYTVLILRPEHVANETGSTFLAHVEADSAAQAQGFAQIEAWNADNEHDEDADPADHCEYLPLFTTNGHLNDLLGNLDETKAQL